MADITDVTRTEIEQANQLAASGQKEQALRIMLAVVRREPDHAQAWLLTARLVPDREKAIYCLKQVLRIDPDHQQAAHYLAKLEGRLEVEPAPAATPAPAPTAAPIAKPISAPPSDPLPPLITTSAAPPRPAPLPKQDNSGMLLMAGGSLMIIALCALVALLVQQRGGLLPAAPTPTTGATSLPASTRSPVTGGGGQPQQVQIQTDPVVTVATEYYTITSLTVDDIRSELMTNAPQLVTGRDTVASTEMNYELNWGEFTAGNICTVANVTVNLSLTYTYPKWQPAGYVDPNVTIEWNKFIAKVNQHEEHHGQLAVDCARQMVTELRGLLSDPSCAAARPILQSYLDSKIVECNAPHDAFDNVETSISFPVP